jgi:aldose 1-epimerase
MSTPPSGLQFELRHGVQAATVVEVGGGIREYRHARRPVLEGYALGSICDGAHGAPLIPWPNRLAGGHYSFDGAGHQLPLDEPERGNAIHGLLRWRPWSARGQTPASVTMQARLLPLEGYPFALEVEIRYELSDDGLEVATSARNIGERPCPYGAGQHPYLSAGGAAVDECTLELPAATRLLNDEHHQIPVGREPVAGTRFDFRQARTLGGDRLDDAFTDLARGGDGRARARLGCPDGAAVELWVDERHRVLQAFTGDTLAPERRRRAVAVEPMTCPANAFASGEGLLRLQPGESVTTTWGVGLLA